MERLIDPAELNRTKLVLIVARLLIDGLDEVTYVLVRFEGLVESINLLLLFFLLLIGHGQLLYHRYGKGARLIDFTHFRRKGEPSVIQSVELIEKFVVDCEEFHLLFISFFRGIGEC